MFICRFMADEDGSGLFLVDFQKKVLDDEEQRRHKERVERERQEEEDERRLQEIPVPEPKNEDEEWWVIPCDYCIFIKHMNWALEKRGLMHLHKVLSAQVNQGRHFLHRLDFCKEETSFKQKNTVKKISVFSNKPLQIAHIYCQSN